MSLLMDLGILNLLINGKSWSNLYVYHVLRMPSDSGNISTEMPVHCVDAFGSVNVS